MFTRARPLRRSEAQQPIKLPIPGHEIRGFTRSVEETVFCLSAAVLARPWPVAGANQMFDVRVLCFLMSHSGAAGRGGWGELGLVSTVCISLRGYNAHCTLRSYWFDYVTSWQWLQGLNFYYSPWNEKCSSGNTFIDRAFIFRSEREKSN